MVPRNIITSRQHQQQQQCHQSICRNNKKQFSTTTTPPEPQQEPPTATPEEALRFVGLTTSKIDAESAKFISDTFARTSRPTPEHCVFLTKEQYYELAGNATEFAHAVQSEATALLNHHREARVLIQKIDANILEPESAQRVRRAFDTLTQEEIAALTARQTQALEEYLANHPGADKKVLGMTRRAELRELQQRGFQSTSEVNQDTRSFKAAWYLAAFTVVLAGVMKVRETQHVTNTTKVTQYQVAGKLDIGGDFYHLVDHMGEEADSTQYKGKYYPLIYFGFTNCPDICPTELNKMMAALDIVEKHHADVYRYVKPIFISVDPLRDTQERLAAYATEFHPRIRWLTGKYEDLLEVAKKFRVYFSIPEDATPESEYNVDHSIFFFLMDRNGELLNYYGQNKTAPEIAETMANVIREDLVREQMAQDADGFKPINTNVVDIQLKTKK